MNVKRVASVLLVGAVICGVTTTAPKVAAAPAPERIFINCAASPGFTIGEPGTYVLRRSVLDCASDPAILIAASDVVLDLDGRLIDGIDAGFGIQSAADTTNIRIRSGAVRDFANGIRLGGERHAVRNMTVASNTGNGIQGGTGNTFTTNNVSGNGDRGFFTGTGNTFVKNVVSGNSDDGILAGTGNTFKKNNVSGNGDHGISVGFGNTLTKNTAKGNVRNGFSGGGNNTYVENLSSGNGDDGFQVGNTSTLIANTASANGKDGIFVADDNKIKNNAAVGNGNNGIFAGEDNTVVSNKAHGNGIDGIFISEADADTVLKKNKANDNNNLGLNTVGVVVPGAGTNRARDNGNPDQCDPVELCG